MRVFLAALLFSGAAVAAAHAQPYELVWQDEFDGTTLDLGKWQPQIGTGCPQLCGWGNNELQYYRAENATVSDGLLTITARDELFGGAAYTSARLRTRNLADFTYGRFEMHAKLPVGQGLWPAFWMLPTDEVYGGWAASGEIDIMEYVGQDPDRVFGTLHYGGTFPFNQSSSNAFTLPQGTFDDEFHTFALEWEPCEMRWYVDGEPYATQTSWFSDGGPYPAPFDQRFHLLLNLAVGGNLPGPPDGTTTFPQELVVDWVRVFQQPSGLACTTEFDDMDHADPFGNGWFTFNGNVGGGGIGANLVDLPPVDGCRASLETGWGSGGTPGWLGGFGRMYPLDVSDATHFAFWINPDAGQSYALEINLQDDDNGDDAVPGTPDGADDEFQYDLFVSPGGPDAIAGGGWQRVSIPLAHFFDDNSYHYGGNGVLDLTSVENGGNGRLVNVVVSVVSTSGSDVTFRTDRWTFTQQESSIAGRIWDDADGDGNEDAGETGLDGVAVDLFDVALGSIIRTEITDGTGAYGFDELLGGPYEVRVDVTTVPGGYVSTHDPDGVLTPDRFGVTLDCDDVLVEQNFAYAHVSVDVEPAASRLDVLQQNMPNPFGARTTLSFEIRAEGPVRLTVYDVTGRQVRSLVDEWTGGGPHEIEWDGRRDDGRRVSPGLYYYVLEAPEGRAVRKMTLVR